LKDEIVKVMTKEEKLAAKKRPTMMIKGETYVPKVKKQKKRLTISEQINLENKKAEEEDDESSDSSSSCSSSSSCDDNDHEHS